MPQKTNPCISPLVERLKKEKDHGKDYNQAAIRKYSTTTKYHIIKK